MSLCLQGAPGNRGFPGQDGLAGPKVGLFQTDSSSLTLWLNMITAAQDRRRHGHEASRFLP